MLQSNYSRGRVHDGVRSGDTTGMTGGTMSVICKMIFLGYGGNQIVQSLGWVILGGW